jgi:hypothetical protein
VCSSDLEGRDQFRKQVKLKFREERFRLYLKAIDIVLEVDKEIDLDDVYGRAAWEARRMWTEFSESILSEETANWLMHVDEAGQSRPSDYAIYVEWIQSKL